MTILAEHGVPVVEASNVVFLIGTEARGRGFDDLPTKRLGTHPRVSTDLFGAPGARVTTFFELGVRGLIDSSDFDVIAANRRYPRWKEHRLLAVETTVLNDYESRREA